MSDTRYETHIQSASRRADEICGIPVPPLELTWITPDIVDIAALQLQDEDEIGPAHIMDEDMAETDANNIQLADFLETLDDTESDASDGECLDADRDTESLEHSESSLLGAVAFLRLSDSQVRVVATLLLAFPDSARRLRSDLTCLRRQHTWRTSRPKMIYFISHSCPPCAIELQKSHSIGSPSAVCLTSGPS